MFMWSLNTDRAEKSFRNVINKSNITEKELTSVLLDVILMQLQPF